MRRNYLLVWQICFTALLVSLVLIGCVTSNSMDPTYIFPHGVEDIESIDLLLNNNEDAFSSSQDAFCIVRSLGKSEIRLFMETVYALETSYCITPPLRGYGSYIAKISYSNGDVEMLGTEHIEFIESGTEPTGVGVYYFSGDAFKKLILSYLDVAHAE